MNFVIEIFDKETELLVFEEELPSGHDSEIKGIMGWMDDQQGGEGYDVTSEQLKALEKLLGKNISDPAFVFQLTCNQSL
jgi:hypothetical protein